MQASRVGFQPESQRLCGDTTGFVVLGQLAQGRIGLALAVPHGSILALFLQQLRMGATLGNAATALLASVRRTRAATACTFSGETRETKAAMASKSSSMSKALEESSVGAFECWYEQRSIQIPIAPLARCLRH